MRKTNMFKTLLTSLFAAACVVPAAALDLELSAGKDPGLRVLTTKEAPEYFGRGLPMGPSALHFNGSSIWAIDSIAGRLVELHRNGNELRAIAVPGGEKLVIADFAIENASDGKPDAFWVIGSEMPEVIKISADGKVLASFSANLSLPAQIALLPQKSIAILDTGLSLIAAFDETGHELWRQPCIGKGFVAETNGDILFLTAKGEEVALCRRNSLSAKVEEICELEVTPDANPFLLTMNGSNEIYFAFHALSEKSGEYSCNICRLSLAEKTMASMSTAFPAAFINRVVVNDRQNLYLVSFIEENGRYILRLHEFADEMLLEASQG